MESYFEMHKLVRNDALVRISTQFQFPRTGKAEHVVAVRYIFLEA